MAAKSKPNEIKIERLYDAPVKMVWEAWTDPEKVAKWWGPRGFTITTHSKDLKPGGHWDYTMHGPDGVDYPNVTKYHVVEKYARLEYDHGGSKDRPPLFHVTAVFTDVKGKTKLEMTMTLPTAEAAEETKKFIKQAGGNSTWDRLAEYLEKEETGKETFVINRSFNAPIGTMFKMWTDPDHFSKWLAPTGFSMNFIRADIKTGGSSYYYMSNDSGMKMYGKANYIEVKAPDTIIYTQQFSDEKENVTRHPMAPTWPETMKTTVKLTEEAPDQTRVTITWEVVGNVTKEEMNTFIAGRAGMTQGWTGSLDKLESYLEKAN
jgi:uncharacterized protein YndB with AHSA1/START domain